MSNIFPNSHLIQKCIHNQQLFQNSCWNCIHIWIKWESGKIFDTKMIEWSHFSMMQGRVKIDPLFLIWALTYRTSRLEKMDWIWSVQCSRFKMSCWSSYMYTPLFLYEFAQWQGSYRSEMNTTRIKLPINVYFKCLRIKTGFTLNVEINFSEARKFFQLSLFRIFLSFCSLVVAEKWLWWYIKSN